MGTHFYRFFFGAIFSVYCTVLAQAGTELNLKSTRTETYLGYARDSKNSIIYIEEHLVTFNSADDVTIAQTTYKSDTGKVLGVMKSDFSRSITAPNYIFNDTRSNEEQGIKYQGNDLILYHKDPGKAEQTRVLESELGKNALLVGCQGLHYYLRKNISNIKPGEVTHIKLLTPGNLDYFSFRLRKVSQDNKLVRLKVDIDNWFLRMFAPSLDLEYDMEKGRLLNYFGISNIKDSKGNYQSVKIDYKYDAAL